MGNLKNKLFPAILLCLLTPVLALAQAKRLVVVKVDGLPYRTVERFARETDPRTGKGRLPWIKLLFYERGTRLANFYARGPSLSAPSWSLLDTGQHLQIKGNVEHDRYTLYSYDYLNYIPYFVNNALSRREDMPAVELLDDLGIPLLIDAYPLAGRYQSSQLNQRGVRWMSLKRALTNRFASRSARELLDEWTTGMDAHNIPLEQVEREITEKLNDPDIRYLDYYTTEFDHAAHHNRDGDAHLHALRNIDAAIGRIWTAIERAPLADETAMVIVSDHGMSTDERIYSQGYSLIELLRSATGGGHHVLTKRRPLADYSIKGVYPFAPLIATASKESYYLKDKSAEYPTALLDFDGNERASVHLRDGDFNLLQILFQQLTRKDLTPQARQAATRAFFATVERRRAEWEGLLAELREELGALRREVEKQSAALEAQKGKGEKEPRKDRPSVRLAARVNFWKEQARGYTEYANALTRLLAARGESFDPRRVRVEDFIPKRAMGDANTIHRLQNYVVGLAPGGLTLASDGSLDMEKSFRRVDYFSLLGGVTVRNNVQKGVSNRPVDFVAVRVPRESLTATLGPDELPDEDAIWLYGASDRQALILARQGPAGRLSLRCLPVADLSGQPDGSVRFQRAEWRAGLPLKLWEDEKLRVEGDRAGWLNEWHTELEWLRAAHETEYSNAVISLHEQFGRHLTDGLDPSRQGLSGDEMLLARFRSRQRRLAEADMLVLANHHWNFDARGFTPGGNHGSFFRVSTHATLMFAGGEKSGVPRGAVIGEPYDSLSFVPTVLKLTGQLQDGNLKPVFWQGSSRPLPGRIIEELFDRTKQIAPPAAGSSVGIR